MQDTRPHQEVPARRDAMLMVLAFAAAYVDAASYFALGRVFPANMTGNTVLLAVAASQGDTAALARSGLALGGFALGVAAAEVVLSRKPERDPWPSSVTVALAFELVPLLALAVGWQLAGPVYVLVALAAVAMGIQSAAVRRLHVTGVATTYMTGTLTSLTAGLVDWLRLSGARAHGPALPAAVWVSYALGAMAGGVAQRFWHAETVLVSVALIATVIAIEGGAKGRVPP